jgi:CHAD domain-containing protein
MSAELKSGRTLSKTLHRIVNRRSRRILKKLAADDADEFVHEARKELKKIRATLRLARDGLGDKARRKLDRHFKKAGQALAGLRDAKVLMSTATKFHIDHRSRRAAVAVSKLRTHLAPQQPRSMRNRPEFEECLASVRDAQAENISWRGIRWRDLGDSLTRTCKLGQDAFEDAKKNPSPEKLHEWRKRSKDLLYQLSILKPARPRPISRLIRRLKRLTEKLGDYHDLVMFDGAIKNANLNANEKEILEAMILAHRNKLSQNAFLRAEKVHNRRTCNLVKNISRARRGKKF